MTIQHVSLEIRAADADAEVRFWELLGFEPDEVPGELAHRTTWVHAGGQQIHLLHAEEPVIPPQAHVAVVCRDYEATQERLRAAGFPVDERRRYWGAPRCLTRSPSGHVVEVMAAPPGG